MKLWKKSAWSFSFIVLLALGILAANIFPTYAAEGDTTYTGWLTIIWGDSESGESTEPQYTLHLPDDNIIHLNLDENAGINPGNLLALDRQEVTVTGVAQLSAEGVTNTLEINSISPADLEANDLQAEAVTGSQPFISVMCKFPEYGLDPQYDLSFFQGMYSSAFPGMDHYWREVSYNTINTVGSSAAGWFTLPQNKSYYNPSNTRGGTNLYTLANDCLNKANPSIDFSQYTGINMMFNIDFDNGYAWGGSMYLNLDGVSKAWPITWEPPWSYSNIGVISHEMGHAFGLPHSSGTYGQTYDNEWDVMSDTWSNCGRSSDSTYGCLGQHTISYHKDKLGWIPANQKLTVNDKSYASVTLEQLALPQTSNYKMVQVPINGSSSNFYTVEVRRQTGYDVKLPGQAVIIHEVSLSRSRPANVIDNDGDGDTGDAGAMWTVGETFTDIANNIEISVTGSTSTGFEISISNDAIAPPENFHVTGSGQYSISLAWDDSSGETGYRVYRKDGGNFVQIATVGANITTFTDQDVSCNASYEYKLSLTTTGGASDQTDAITGATSSTCPDPPPNDNFANAAEITSPSTTNARDTREATQEVNDPDLSACDITGSGQGTVWYFYEATSNTAVAMDTLSADYDTFIAVWTGTYPSLNLVACNNDASGTQQSQVAFQVTNGTTYYIEIGKP